MSRQKLIRRHVSRSGRPVHLHQMRSALVNQPKTEAEVHATGRRILRGCSDGTGDWVQRTAASLGLESTLRGCPKVVENDRSDKLPSLCS